MGSIRANDRLVRVPNSDAWIDGTAVVAVAKLKDSEVAVDQPGMPKIKMVNFQIRLMDGHAVNVQHHDRQAMIDFLNSIGVTWEG